MRAVHVYLYAVIPYTDDCIYSPHGVLGLPVALCSQGDVSAAISLVPMDAEPASPPAHARVMRQLLRHTAVLPAPVPTVLPSQSALHEMLATNQQRLLRELQRFQGLIEVRLEVVERRVEGAPSRAAAERDYLLARLCTALRSGGFCVRQLPRCHPQDVLRIACLLPAAFLSCFTITCESLKKTLGPTYELLGSAPMAPIDFISRGLFSAPEMQQVRSAGAQADRSAAARSWAQSPLGEPARNPSGSRSQPPLLSAVARS